MRHFHPVILIFPLPILAVLLLFDCNPRLANTDQGALRIVSHAPNLTEICFALGLGDSLVGVSDYSDYPPEAKKIARIGALLNPDFERVLALKPTLALLLEYQKGLAEKYEKLGIKVVAVRSDSIEEVFSSIRSIGDVTGRRSNADELIRKIRSDMDHIQGKATGKVKTLVVVGHEPGALSELYAAGGGSFYNEMLLIAGGENCLGESKAAYPKISKEEILARSPEVIIVLSEEQKDKAQIEKNEKALWAELNHIDAVKNDRICVISGKGVFIPGPRMASIAEYMHRCLYPEGGSEK